MESKEKLFDAHLHLQVVVTRTISDLEKSTLYTTSSCWSTNGSKDYGTSITVLMIAGQEIWSATPRHS